MHTSPDARNRQEKPEVENSVGKAPKKCVSSRRSTVVERKFSERRKPKRRHKAETANNSMLNSIGLRPLRLRLLQNILAL
jgi:hypothetical protein